MTFVGLAMMPWPESITIGALPLLGFLIVVATVGHAWLVRPQTAFRDGAIIGALPAAAVYGFTILPTLSDSSLSKDHYGLDAVVGLVLIVATWIAVLGVWALGGGVTSWLLTRGFFRRPPTPG